MIQGPAGGRPAESLLDRNARTRPRVDDHEFAEFYATWATKVYRFALALMGDAHAAEDVMISVFTSAFRTHVLAQIPREAHGAWLFKVAKNKAATERRRLMRRAEVALDYGRDLSGYGPRPDDAFAARERAVSVARGLETLPRRDRELLALRFGAGMSFAEVGRVLSLTEGAARTATHRATLRARAALEAYGWPNAEVR